MFDYGVGLHDVLQLVVKSKAEIEENQSKVSQASTSSKLANKTLSLSEPPGDEFVEAESLWYAPGDSVDCLDRSYGAWFEATILKILAKDSELVYRVHWNFVEDDEPFDVTENMIRPRARRLLSYDELGIGDRVMINVNTESPTEDGFWYDLTISKIKQTRTVQELIGTLHIGR